MQKIVISCVLLAYSGSCFSYDWVPERRKDQFPTTPAHLVVPLPYSKPGIGKGVVLLGSASNVAETTTDVSAFLIGGDANGAILFGTEIPLYSDFLFLNFDFLDIDKATINNYSIRGINNTNENDYTLLDIGGGKENELELNLSFYERRLNFNYSYSDFEFKVDAIRDNNGVLITTLGESFVNSGTTNGLSVLLDFTDDYLDARTGLKFEISYQDQKAENINEPDFYTLDFNLLGYIPVSKADTLVINYAQSDAHVRRQGNINPDDIRAELDAGCAPTDMQCLTTEQELVDNFISSRTYGTATSLGGDLRLRSFPQDRYQGAHSAFIGFEYRWNFEQEAKPFDYYIWKDIRTGLQVAFFAEIGTVSETSSQLWDETRSSIGSGFRLVAASGAVYRADIATGKEGTEVIIIFEYPWE